MANENTGRLEYEVRSVWVTPEIAVAMLERNLSNRPIRPRKVGEYAAEMAAGRWRMNGDTIKVGPDGALVDGQHRLAAVAKAGIRLLMLVVTVPSAREAFETVDRGMRRSAGDSLALAGYGSGHALAAAVRFCVTYEADALSMRANMGSRGGGARLEALTAQLQSNQEIRSYVERNPHLAEVVAEASLHKKQFAGTGLGVGPVSGLWFLFGRAADEAAARNFWERVSDGVALNDGDPRLVLRNRLHVVASNRAKVPAMQVWAISIKAWNAWVRGERIRILKTMPDEQFPRIRTARGPWPAGDEMMSDG